ncbi:serine protease [Paenibacillus nanensis]|uniref:Serine protease n=1 Tax=Paenibacillus nanensis TaxID=393251 RepID=A0A3A1UNE9_9BACL|nr:S8 family serine peptidase [Paenibacillus nanensis]RIX50059.1 serine protease [Paenibacillus nanensis]
MKAQGMKKASMLLLGLSLLVGTFPMPGTAAAADSGELGNSQLIQISSVVPQTEAYISDNVDTESSRLTTVIVTLASEPIAVSGLSARNGLSAQIEEASTTAIATEQSAVMTNAKKMGISLSVQRRFNTVLNAMEVTLPANQIPELASIPGVVSIYENRTYYALPVDNTDEAGYEMEPLEQIGVDQAWLEGLTGEGLKVGVIDTGVDYLHPDLAGAYKGGYDSYSNDNDPYEDVPHGSTYAGTSHGTHVAGTIVGRAAQVGSDIVQKGVAYEADLYAYKVLGYDEQTGKSSGSSAQVIDGIEHAVEQGMDVINLSLGSDYEKDPNSPDAIAVNNAVLSGVVAVVANGNAGDNVDGQYYYSSGTPASAQLAIAVGAVSSESKRYTAEATSTLSADPFSLNLMAWRTGEDNFEELFGTDSFEGVYVGLGAPSDYEGKDVTGKIVFASRGDLAFMDKVTYAKEHGAKAIIIFNGNVKSDGTPNLESPIAGRDGHIGSVGFLGDSLHLIPAFDMEGVAGRALAKQVLANPDTPLMFSFGSFNSTVVPGDHVASFSSRGPIVGGNYDIKPDIVAPGVNVMSTVPAYGISDPNANYAEAYDRNSGTSMATPHVAGLALLLKEKHPEWTPFDVRSALTNTAEVVSDANGVQYDVYSQGSGRVNVAHALVTPALLQTVEQIQILDENLKERTVTNYNGSVSFGLMQPGEAAQIKTLQLKNTSSASVTYTASVRMHPSVTSDPNDPIATPDVSNINVELTGLENGSITADAGTAQPFALEAAPSANAAAGVYEGEVVLEASGVPSLHLPFVVNVGEGVPSGFGVEDITLTSRNISPNNDNWNDTTQLSFKLTADGMNVLALSVYNLNDEYLGDMQFVEDEYEPGMYSFDIDGTYIDGEVDEDDQPIIKQLSPGVYKLGVIAARLLSNGTAAELYEAYSSLRIVDVQEEVDAAAVALVPTIDNTTELNQPVLGLPDDTTAFSYLVTASNNEQLIGNDGILKVLPTTSSTVVQLTVTVSSVSEPGKTATKTVDVTLAPSPNTPNPGPIVPTAPEADKPAAAPDVQPVMNQGQQKTEVAAEVKTEGTVKKASVSNTALVQSLAAVKGNAQAAAVIYVPANSEQAAQVGLTAENVDTLKETMKGSSVIVTTDAASVALPTSALRNVAPGAAVEIHIDPRPEESSAFSKGIEGATVVGTPVSYEVQVIKDGVASPIVLGASDYVKRSFSIEGDIDASQAGVLYIENGVVRPVPGKITASKNGGATVTVNRPGFSTYAVATRDVAFQDIGSSYAKAQIETLAHKFLVNGTSEQSFSPKNNVTRAEFAALLSRALGLTATRTGEAPFSDVKPADWFADDVAAVYEAGIVKGTGNNRFSPNEIITRQDLTVMLSNAMQLLQVKTSTPSHTAYTDEATFAGYAKSSIEAVSKAGIMNGVPVKGAVQFQPNEPTTREAAVMVLYKLLRSAELIN